MRVSPRRPIRQARVVAGDVEGGASHVLALRAAQVDHDVDVHEVDEPFDDVRSHLDDVGGLLQHSYAHAGGLAAHYSEQASLALANYVYFDLAALCVELL